MRRLVLMGEGHGEIKGLPGLVSRLLNEHQGTDVLFVDGNVMRIKGLSHLVKDDFLNWRRYLCAACRRSDIGAILVVLDGDIDEFPARSGYPFCAVTAASQLASIARQAIGNVRKCSVTIVIALQEFESWIIAGARSLAGAQLADGRSALRAGAEPPPSNLEQAPRDAKRWLSENMPNGYSPVRDQHLLIQRVELSLIRQREEMKSFRRLEHAIQELVAACRQGDSVFTPQHMD